MTASFYMSMTPYRVYFSILAFLLAHNNHDSHLPLLCTAQLFPGDPTYQDYYCGRDWEEAHQYCEFHCPSGLNEDCPPLPNGRQRRCIAAAGCFARFTKVYWTGVFSLSFDKEQHLAAQQQGSSTSPEAADEEGANNNDGLMTDEETEAFEASFQSYLFDALQEQMQISGVSMQEQEYNRPCVAAAANGGNDPDSTSLDMVIRIVGEYIPIGDKSFTDSQFGEEVMASIRENPEAFVNGIKGSSSFFDALTGITAIDEDSVAESPSAMPSAPPSRGFDQTFDIRIDSRPTGSYGIVFNVKTPRGGSTILLTAMSFVTLHEGKLEYEIYSRMGSYEKFIGKNSLWELVASGQTIGRGSKAYTRVLEEDTVVDDGGTVIKYVGFKPLHVLGDRGQRSFYVTLTKRFKSDGDVPIPILFSYPIKDVEGVAEYEIVDSTPELEVYEGDGVLDYPWPKDTDGPYFRRPRGFIGHFDYDRYPCHPLLNVTTWPCPYMPRTNRPSSKPTKRPTSAPVPVPKNPTMKPQNAPTMSPVALSVEIGTDAQTETDAPDLTASGSGPEADKNNNDATLTVGVEGGGTDNGSFVSWKVAYRSYGCGVVLFMMYLS